MATNVVRVDIELKNYLKRIREQAEKQYRLPIQGTAISTGLAKFLSENGSFEDYLFGGEKRKGKRKKSRGIFLPGDNRL